MRKAAGVLLAAALAAELALVLALSNYCMPPSTATSSFLELCKKLTDVDPLDKCAPGLELLGFGVDVTMCKSYGCRPSIDYAAIIDSKAVNT